MKKLQKRKGSKPIRERHGDGTTHWHNGERTGGHAFVDGSKKIVIPGAALGSSLFGEDSWAGEAVDFFNPLSDIQDLVDLFDDSNCP